MKSIVLASSNQGKLREFAQILAAFDFEVIPQSQLNVPDVPETGLSFVENALIKARNAAQHTSLPAMSDDSGIEVDALQGAPGIYSARFAGEKASDADNNKLLLEKLKDIPDEQRTARYHCVIVYMHHANDPMPLICQGTWEGRILHEPRGEHGFGYDPFFYVPTHQCASAELPPEVKNQLSHRGQALRILQTTLQSSFSS
ncbi:RdgB/HAM1 family non-canonical purine NTP pyrophosphatase [Candidatus Parabeggiatoa sp. HSG14]|uniref:RdgB/HAM1 family non-canonical purine NTP pyrophosphatase n=1 Tax=Candidatus Parabeggiatoa sp. HSG14 TaxID=3055593 RepID=UPI0025A8EE1E|nr:RdgB/HAM1 family non-canonical purine NTP pyrophosphatase [Thiotrichales bacterium HSG14]